MPPSAVSTTKSTGDNTVALGGLQNVIARDIVPEPHYDVLIRHNINKFLSLCMKPPQRIRGADIHLREFLLDAWR